MFNSQESGLKPDIETQSGVRLGNKMINPTGGLLILALRRHSRKGISESGHI